MNDALWLLLKLRLKAWGRRLVRNASTVKGAIMTAVFALLMCFWGFSLIAGQALDPKKSATADPVAVQRFGAPGLAMFCIMIVLTSGARPPVLFTPAEIQFLFCGPFSRRQLLTYKLLTQFLMTLPFSMFMAIVFRGVAGSYLSAAFGALLIFSFLQLFGIAVNFTASYFSALAYNRFRKVALFAILAVAAVGGAILVQRYAAGGDLLQMLKDVESNTVVYNVLTPLRWYSQVVTAKSIAQFSLPALGALGINVFLLFYVYVLDAKFLETVSTASEKVYAKIERMRRSGGSPFQSHSQSRVIRRQVPSFPFWGGVGPIFWRQFVTAQRTQKAFLMMVVVMGIGAIGPTIAMLTKQNESAGMPWGIAGMMLMMSLFVHQFLAFDFRADVDRIEVLKTLPLPAWRIVLGQLLAPTVFASLVQLVLVSVVYAVLGKIGLLVAIVALCALPFNLLLVGIDNLMFLLLPTRMVATTPGDFSHAGRQMVVFFGRMLALFLAMLLPGIFGGITYAVTRNPYVAGVVGWLLLVLVSFAPVPFVSWAFRRFDVARDTPP